MEIVSIIEYEQRTPVQYVKGMEQLEELVSWQANEKKKLSELKGYMIISQKVNNYMKTVARNARCPV